MSSTRSRGARILSTARTAGLLTLLASGAAFQPGAAGAGGPVPAVRAAPPASAPERPGVAPSAPVARSVWSRWKSLRFEARQLLFFHGQVEMSRRVEGPHEILETRTVATFMGATLLRTRTTSVMDAQTGRAVEFWELSSRSGRHTVFGPAGYRIERLRPPASGPDAPGREWRVKSAREFTLPAPLEGAQASAQLHDPYGMLLQLRRQSLEKPGDEVTLTVATSRGAEPYRVRVTETRMSQRSVTDAATGATLTREPIRELRLRVTPASPDPDDEGFMRMEGETEIWVEAATRTLLEIDGSIPRVPGRVEVLLTAVGQ